MKPRIAILVLNYNTPHLTDPLAVYLQSVLHYAGKDVYVIDNGSEKPPRSTTHRLPENLGFTRGMYEAWKIASSAGDYSAFWFLNFDVGFEYGDDILSDLVDVLFSSGEFAQISPQFNSPHQFMEKADCAAQKVPIWSQRPHSSRHPPSRESVSGISISATAGAWITFTAFACAMPGPRVSSPIGRGSYTKSISRSQTFPAM